MFSELPADTNLSSPQIKLMTDWNVGFKEVNVGIIEKHLHKDFRRTIYPQSIGQPEETKEEFLKKISGAFAYSASFDTTAHSIIEEPGRVVAHATTEHKTSLGLETNYEWISIVHFVTDEDGSLTIKKSEDFFDTKVRLETMQSIGAVIGAAQANNFVLCSSCLA